MSNKNFTVINAVHGKAEFIKYQFAQSVSINIPSFVSNAAYSQERLYECLTGQIASRPVDKNSMCRILRIYINRLNPGENLCLQMAKQTIIVKRN